MLIQGPTNIFNSCTWISKKKHSLTKKRKQPEPTLCTAVQAFCCRLHGWTRLHIHCIFRLQLLEQSVRVLWTVHFIRKPHIAQLQQLQAIAPEACVTSKNQFYGKVAIWHVKQHTFYSNVLDTLRLCHICEKMCNHTIENSDHFRSPHVFKRSYFYLPVSQKQLNLKTRLVFVSCVKLVCKFWSLQTHKAKLTLA